MYLWMTQNSKMIQNLLHEGDILQKKIPTYSEKIIENLRKAQKCLIQQWA